MLLIHSKPNNSLIHQPEGGEVPVCTSAGWGVAGEPKLQFPFPSSPQFEYSVPGSTLVTSCRYHINVFTLTFVIPAILPFLGLWSPPFPSKGSLYKLFHCPESPPPKLLFLHFFQLTDNPFPHPELRLHPTFSGGRVLCPFPIAT